MPNWGYNYMTIEGKKEDVLKAIRSLYAKKKPYISLRTIIEDKIAMSLYKKMEEVKDYDKTEEYAKLYEESVKEGMDKIANFNLENVDETLSFEGAIPIPDEVRLDRQGAPHPTGASTPFWYDWCCRNWGTKWDMSDADEDYVSDIEEGIKKHEDGENASISFLFNTAWSPPEPWFKAISLKNPDVLFTFECTEESSAYFYHVEYSNGEIDVLFDGENEIEWNCYRKSSIDYILYGITWGDLERAEEILKEDTNRIDDFVLYTKQYNYNYDSMVMEIADYFDTWASSTVYSLLNGVSTESPLPKEEQLILMELKEKFINAVQK